MATSIEQPSLGQDDPNRHPSNGPISETSNTNGNYAEAAYMAGILEIDSARRIARVQPGVILDSLRNAAEHFHLTHPRHARKYLLQLGLGVVA